MKKTLIALAIVGALGIGAVQSADARWGRGGGGGCGNCNGPVEDEAAVKARQEFFNKTSEQREAIQEKQQAYRQLLDQDEVDKEKAQALWSEIFDLKKSLQAQAKEAGIELGAGGGRGRYTCDGPGQGGYGCGGPQDRGRYNCNGPNW